MIVLVFVIITFTVSCVMPFDSGPPRYCDRSMRYINDCNWCVCVKSEFQCASRDCRTVDMFGHFNDAIRDIDTGLKGRGSWRTRESVCEPGTHYRRGSLMCVCDENGNWPNPVCRDIFRMLHAVEKLGPSETQKCEPSKLYLVECNVCFCPPDGVLNPELCTKRECTENDPVLQDDTSLIANFKEQDSMVKDVYAECRPDIKYKIGCQQCLCLRNNRLLCGDCDFRSKEKNATFCDNMKPGQVFHVDCNQCYCQNGYSFCTTKKCLSGTVRESLERQLKNGFPDPNLVSVDTPYEDYACIPGTKFKKGCNNCYCTETDGGVKNFVCTLKYCGGPKDAITNLQSDCVANTLYESNCLICYCELKKGIKWEFCQVNPECKQNDLKEMRSHSLDSMHGYCEPLHVYKKDCNTCNCLSDGKTVMCTANLCAKDPKKDHNVEADDVSKEEKSISIQLTPVKANKGGVCPRGRKYKIDCNQCVCLLDGNALCTTLKCNKRS